MKAESDICCTSGNALTVVESLGAERVIMLPDEYLAQNIAAQTDVKIIAWKGHCEVHERFTPADVRQLRENHPGVIVLAHPECPPEVVAEADFSGSTAAMSDFVGKQRPPRVVLLTECSMSDNVAVQHPDVEFIRPCNLCPHMKRITLTNIRARAGDEPARGDDRSRDRRAGAARGRTDAGDMSADISALANRPVIIGGGVAGLMTALQLAPEPVVLLSKAPLGAEASSLWAQGGLAARDGRGRRPCPASGRHARRRRRPVRRSRREADRRRGARGDRSISHGLASPSTAGPMAAGGSASKPRTAATGSCMPPATAPAARSCAR